MFVPAYPWTGWPFERYTQWRPCIAWYGWLPPCYPLNGAGDIDDAYVASAYGVGCAGGGKYILLLVGISKWYHWQWDWWWNIPLLKGLDGEHVKLCLCCSKLVLKSEDLSL